MYNLLLVDDEPLIKVAFQSAVEWGKNGFLLAATASNGQEALHIVETQHIDAVIVIIEISMILFRTKWYLPLMSRTADMWLLFQTCRDASPVRIPKKRQ